MKHLLLLALLLASPAWGAVTLDANSTGGTSGTSSITDSITIGSGSNRFVICGVSGQDDTVTISSATLGAQSMDVSTSPIVHATAHYATFLVFLKAPNSGAGTVTVNWSTAVQGAISCKSLAGVDQTTPVGTASSTDNGETTGTTSTLTLALPSGGAIFDTMSLRSTSAGLAPTGNNVEGTEVDNGGTIGVSVSTNLIDGTNSWGWTDAVFRNQIAIPINAAASSRRPLGVVVFE